jgi:PIN domain nuclease of toxin-antitoxin system
VYASAQADTHTVIWYLYDDPRLSPTARAEIEEAAYAGDQIGFSSITLAEIVYLGEKGRIHPEAFGRVLDSLDEPGAPERGIRSFCHGWSEVGFPSLK